MNILFTYIRRHLLNNKISTLITIFSISCASAMFFIVTCLGINGITSIYDSSIKMYGNYHTVFTNVSNDFIEYLDLHTKVNDIFEIEFKDEYKTDLILNNKKDSFQLLGINENSFNELGFLLISGRFPLSNNEVIVSDDLINNTKEDVTLNSNIVVNNETYKIVGIISSNFLELENNYYVLFSNIENIGTKNVYINYFNRDETYKNTNQIASYFNDEYDDLYINHYVVLYDLDSISMTLILLFAFGFIMFIFMNVLLIINCYKNSYANREKHLAILKTVGVTQSQCKTMIMYEGILLLTISLIFGLITGWFYYDLLVYFINMLLSNIKLNFIEISSKYKLSLLLLTILYVSIISYISIRKSTKKIISQTVSFTLQSNDEVTVMNEPYLELDKERDIFIRLLRKNIQQNKRSYTPLVVGITLIVSVFIFVNSMMGYLREDILMNSYDQNYDCEVVIYNDYYPTSIMTQLKNIGDNVNVVISEKMILTTKDIDKFNKDYLNLIAYDNEINIDVLTYSDRMLNEFYSNYDMSTYDGIIINETYSLSQRRYYDILNENRLSLYYDDNCIFETLNLYSTDKLITGTQYKKNPQLIIDNHLFKSIFTKISKDEHEYHIYFQTNDSDTLIRKLNKIDYTEINSYSINNIDENIKTTKLTASLIRFILYGYVFLLSIMGILIMSCVTTINFDYRKKEFTLFRVMGLRFVDMMQLIFFELTYYLCKLLIYSWLLSQSLNYIVYKLYFENLGLMFFIPVNSLIGSIILSIVALIFFMNYIHMRMKKLKYTQVLKNEISLM